MRYITDRKRAIGKGASGTGTKHHWSMQVSSVGLAVMVPVWLYIFGSALGQPHEVVINTFSRPFPAILTSLMIIIGTKHFVGGATMMIEDYADKAPRKIALIVLTMLGWSIGATGLFAIARIAL